MGMETKRMVLTSQADVTTLPLPGCESNAAANAAVLTGRACLPAFLTCVYQSLSGVPGCVCLFAC